jgi:hypothetical protein
MRSTLLAALATVGLVGCVGGLEQGDPVAPETGDDGNDDGGNPAGGDLTVAKQLFDQNVYPALTAKCTGGACHSETATGSTLTRFVATDPSLGWQIATNYAALVGNYAASAAPILTHVAPGHQGTSWTSDEVTKITAWLTAEVEARNGQPPAPTGAETLSQATERVLSEFAGCMTLTDFQTANMKQWGNVNAQNNTQCRDCHATGGEGFFASDQDQPFYTVISTKKYFFLQYLTVDLTKGAALAAVVPNTTSFAGVNRAQDPHREHPTFNLNNNGKTALEAFHAAVMARKTAGTCDPPRPLGN